MPLASVCVFLGSSTTVAEAEKENARAVGRALAERGIRLVYGGAHVGPMGALADACRAAGGQVTGVIPAGLEEREVAHRGLDELRVVDTLAERKRIMADLADAFVVLPGGLGTLDEAFEVLTWKLLGIVDKPLCFADLDGYYAALLAFLDGARGRGYVRPEHARLWEVAPDLAALFAWLDRLQTSFDRARVL